ncbi:unnamed protein product [Malus baccata var. baccata]
MDKSWLTIPQNFEAYTTGINLFLDQAVANGVGPDKFKCPCKRSCNRYTFVRNTIVEHLILYDMDKDYKNTLWLHHGEQNIREQNVAIGEEETGDAMIGMHDFLIDVFVQPLTEEGVGPSTEPPIGEGRPEEVETFFRLLEEADQDLWPGCKEFKKLEAVVRLYQIKCLAGMPNKIFTTLLELIKRMLPEGDCLPESCYKAKKLINDLGLTYVKIDACPNDCMIYWKDTSDLTMCSICGPRNSGKEIDVYMRPLIDELNELWEKDALGGQRRKRTSSSSSSNSQWKKKSIFYELPYWRHLLIRHNLDVMHIEKNICDNVVGTLLDTEKSKDGLAARADLEVLNIRRSQHPRRKGNRTFLPPALFTLKREEKTVFCKVLSTIRVPDGYSSNLSRCVHVNERKIHGLKSHDCHVLMQQLLSLAIRPVLPKVVTMVLLELSAIFRQLCSKKESEEGFNELNSRIALTLCQLEKIFPPTFFDIMVHLPVHLADEAALGGHFPYRWMYPIERFRIKYVDDKHKNRNCGVFVPANVLGAIGQVNCYGRVVDIFEVKYCGHTEAGDRGRAVMLFKCE